MIWEATPPALYSIVTGFFPETAPKDTWATNPRPLLVCGRATDPETGMHFCRIAYGTSQSGKAWLEPSLAIGNFSMLNALQLKIPTTFVLKGSSMIILPWTQEFFRPWRGKPSPYLSILPADMQRYVGATLAEAQVRGELPSY